MILAPPPPQVSHSSLPNSDRSLVNQRLVRNTGSADPRRAPNCGRTSLNRRGNRRRAMIPPPWRISSTVNRMRTNHIQRQADRRRSWPTAAIHELFERFSNAMLVPVGLVLVPVNRRWNILRQWDGLWVARIILFGLRRELEQILIGIFDVRPRRDNFRPGSSGGKAMICKRADFQPTAVWAPSSAAAFPCTPQKSARGLGTSGTV